MGVEMRGFVVLAMAWLALSGRSVQASIVVAGNANIFGAGHLAPPAPGGQGGGVLPVQVPIVISSGTVITFSSVTGLANEGGGTGIPGWENSWNGPDGFQGAASYNSVGGIAGLLMPRRMPLVGVFLDDTEPGGTAPERLDFNVIGINFSSLAPGLRQVFFIGDGEPNKECFKSSLRLQAPRVCFSELQMPVVTRETSVITLTTKARLQYRSARSQSLVRQVFGEC